MVDQVQEVKEKTDIVDVVGEFVELKKAGRHFRGLCPFHHEKSPSFMVSPELQIYKCFGCGESGDVIAFLMKYEGLDFGEALAVLAEKAGVELKRVSRLSRTEKEELIEINELVARFYHFILLKHPLGKEGLEYLSQRRGISLQTIDEFDLGCSPESGNLMFNYLTQKKKIDPKLLEKAGVVVHVRGRWWDRFRGRVVFPIKDYRGRVIALAGRIMPKLEGRDLAKYINSPETLVYKKSASLYGIDRAKEMIRETKEAIIVEGEIDLISLWQAGIKNVVAIKGTALTEEQVRLVSRFAKTVLFCLDSDFAGDNAAIRGLKIAQQAEIELKVVKLGSFKDPDEFVRQDLEGFRLALKSAIGIWDFLIEMVIGRHDLSDSGSRAKISRELVPILALITDGILRAHFVKKVAEKLDVPEEAVNEEVEKYLKGVVKKTEVFSRPVKIVKKDTRELVEERILAIALQTGEIKKVLDLTGEMIKTGFIGKVFEEMKRLGDGFEIGRFVDTLPGELKDRVAGLFIEELGAEEEGDLMKELEKLILRLRMIDLKERMASALDDVEFVKLSKERVALEKKTAT